MNQVSKFVSIIAGIVLFGLSVGAAGFVVGATQIWPYELIKSSAKIVISIIRYGEVVPERLRFLAPNGASRDRVTVYDGAAAMGRGYYVIMGWDSATGHYAAWLYDGDASLIHTWPIDEMSFSKKAWHPSNAPHALEVMPDGTLLVGFDHLGLMARLSACGKPLWTRDGYFHHAFSPATDGGIWTWYGGQTTAYGQIHDLLKFDPETGQDIARISLNTDIIGRSAKSALQFSMRPDFAFTPDDQDPLDILHPNDVEELLPDIAAAFPMFEAGDLLISIREPDLVAVISPAGDLKWAQSGPWLRQHDPDFDPNGTITIYDNSRDRPQSLILSVNPSNGEVGDVLPDIKVPFKSEYRGTHQRLPNGNMLLTVPEQGQVLELAEGGRDLVLAFNNVSHRNPIYNEDVANAKWLPEGFFTTLPSCPN